METTRDSATLERAHLYFEDPKKYNDFNDLRLILAPAELSEALLEAARCRELKPTLILCHPPNGDRCDICELALWASAREYSWLQELCSDPLFQGDFILLLNSRKETCEFRASRKVNSGAVNMDKLVSRLLSCLLITGRPLRYYGCTFFLPLDLQLDEDLQEKGEAFKQLIESLVESPDVEHHQINPSKKISQFSPDESEVQAYLYFLPLLRDFIVDTQDSISKSVAIKPIQHWRLRPETIQKMSLKLGSPCAPGKQNFPNLIAKICDVSLYRYYNDLLLFSLRIELNEMLPKGSSLLENNDTWWHDLLDFSNNQNRLMEGDLQSLQIENWLRFTKLARILYPSFIEQVAEKKIDYVTLLHTQHQPIIFSAADKFSPILINLLKYFFSAKATEKELIRRLDHIPEDRMFVNVAYGLAGPTPEVGC